jgi:hypothetical protein
MEPFVRIDGYGIKKDGSASQTASTVELKKNSKVIRFEQKLAPNVLEKMSFEGTTRLGRVEAFLAKELKKLS